MLFRAGAPESQGTKRPAGTSSTIIGFLVQPNLHDLLDKEDKETSLTFSKGLSVILAFEGNSRGLSIPEIAAKVGLNRAVTRRLVRTLEKLGIATSDRGRYELTPRVLRLAEGFMQMHGIPQHIQPLLRNASNEIGESISFAMLDDDEAIYVAHAIAPTRFTLNMVTVGSRVPLAPTAIGRAMLAFLDKARRDDILDRLDLTAYTPRTLTDRKALNDLLGLIRISGFCYSEGEYIEGVSSLAVPVFDPKSRLVGAVSIIFPLGQYEEGDIKDRLRPQLARCAEDVGTNL